MSNVEVKSNDAPTNLTFKAKLNKPMFDNELTMEAYVLNLHSMPSGAERRNIAPPPGTLKISCGPGPNYG